MPDKFLLEDGTGGILLEDGTGVLLIERYIELVTASGLSTSDTTPTLEFIGTDPQADSITYNIHIDTVSTFDSSPGANDVTVDQYPSSNASGDYQIYQGAAQHKVGQAISISWDFIPKTAQFYLTRLGTLTGNVVADVYAASGVVGSTGLAVEPPLATSNGVSAATLSTTATMVTFTFPTPVLCLAGDYVIGVRMTDMTGTDASNHLKVATDVTSPSHAGNACRYLNPAGYWQQRTEDFIFSFVADEGGPLINKFSNVDAGFVNTINGADTDPFNSGEQVSYTVQPAQALSAGTYYWRVRAKDPAGRNIYSDWSDTRNFTIASGTQYSQSVSGALSFTGDLSRRASKSLAGALSFTGAFTKNPNKQLTGGLSFTGALAKRAAKGLSGALSFAGTLTSSRVFAATLTAALSFTGALARRTSRAFTGAMSFTGSLAKTTSKAFSGALSFAGTLSKLSGKVLTASVGFAGAFTKRAVKTVSGGLSFSGALTAIKTATRALTGALSFSGAFAKSTGKSLTGGLTFTGGLTKRAGRAFTGALSFAGALSKRAAKSLSGTLSFSGALTTIKALTRAFTAALSFSGAFAKASNKTLTGSLGFAGALARRVGKDLAGVVSFSGSLTKRTSKSFAGAVSFAGNLVKSVPKTFAGAVSFAGSLLKTPRRAFSGAVSFSGALTASLSKQFTAALGFAGALTKRTSKFFAGALSFTGTFVGSLENKARDFVAGLSFSGSLSKSTPRQFSGGVSFTGELTRRTNKFFTGALTFGGAFGRTAQKYFSGAVSFSGAFKSRGQKYLTAALSFAGALRKTTYKSFSGSLSFVGSLSPFLVWVEIQAFVKGVFLTMAHWAGAVMSLFAVDKTEPVFYEDGVAVHHEPGTSQSVKVKGPQEVAYKRGTNVMFGTTFTDPKTGQLFDPDTGTVKLYCKFASTGAYLTGYDRATGGKTMTKLSVGDYEADVQFQLTDTVGQYEVEMEGMVGTKRYLDSVKISVKA